MKFDKTKVYTALNADELKIGSKCIFSNTIKSLQQRIQEENTADYVDTFTGLYDDGSEIQFSNGLLVYTYAYLIETPERQKKWGYKPFSSIEKAKEIIANHGGWVKDKKYNVQLLVLGFDDDNGFFIGNGYSCSYTCLFLDYVFADDGSPCGELAEE